MDARVKYNTPTDTDTHANVNIRFATPLLRCVLFCFFSFWDKILNFCIIFTHERERERAMSLPSPPPGRERQRSHPSREGVGGEGEGTEDGRARKEKHQRHLDAFFMVQSSSFSRDERLKIAREKERKTHRREGSRGEDDEGKRLSLIHI